MFLKGGIYMGKLLEKWREENKDKIKIGACLELTFLFENLESDFNRIIEFIKDNSKLLNNQMEYTLTKSIEDTVCLTDNYIEIILSDIDKDENFCKYHSKYY
jgi:hypothetical protein